ncbi:MAG TPA: PLD nuclease N-terminal domain-containing protein [Candidatus Nanopelagicales bacterium]|nr:PLD nuclease N-terminal domain-containing protein [Candidatus Nanopelagicales bacterium]
MIRFLPYLLELALLVFCLIDCIQTPSHQIRNLEKPVWVVLIVLLPLIGGVAWLVAGRPQTARSSGSQWRIGNGFPEDSRPRRDVTRNEDDAAFMAEMARIDREHAESLRKWEAKLAAQEAELKRRESGDPAP